jgi:hypothetical protein
MMTEDPTSTLAWLIEQRLRLSAWLDELDRSPVDRGPLAEQIGTHLTWLGRSIDDLMTT